MLSRIRRRSRRAPSRAGTTATSAGAWDVAALDEAWRPGQWLEPPARPVTGSMTAEVALVGAVAALHIADHTLIPERHHVGVHLGAALGAVLAAGALGATPTELGLRPDRLGRGTQRGAVAAGVIAAGVAVAAALPRSRPMFLDERVLDVSAREVAAQSLVHIPLGTALYEELVFRSVVLGLALRRLPPLPAVALSASLFGVWHIFPALNDQEANPATRQRSRAGHVAGTVLSTTIAGYAFAWERLRANSVAAPVLTHAAINAVTFAVAALVARRHRAGVS